MQTAMPAKESAERQMAGNRNTAQESRQMSESTTEQVDKRQDDGLLSTIIPVLVSAIVAIACSLAYDKFFRSEAPAAQVNSPILVFSMDDWVKQIPPGATSQEMEQVFIKGRQAAQAAAQAGYVVINEANVVASPAQARLVPGMFEQVQPKAEEK